MKTPISFQQDAFTRAASQVSEHAAPAIVITQVDPDAVACAFAMRWIIQAQHEVIVPIFYAGSIAHPQNRSILNKYNLLSSMQEIGTMKDDKTYGVILVDSSQLKDGRAPALARAEVLMVVDHHRGSDIDDEGRFVWIEEVGACSTMMAEILFGLFDSKDEEVESAISVPAQIKTLLALGIYTDTKGLVSGGKRDREAYAWLTQELEPSEVAQFIEYPLPESHFNHLKEALSQMSRKNDKIVASCGVMAEGDGDDLSTIADYLIRMTGVTLVVVWAIIGTKVRVSARNRDLTTPLDQFLKERLGAKSGAKLAPDGRGEGGAVLDLDLGPWYCDETRSHVLAMVKAKFEAMIFTPLK